VSAVGKRPILVTRPEEPGRRLAEELLARGALALWLPAFDLLPAPDPRHASNVLESLEQFDLAVFVSPAAVRATVDMLNRPWPLNTAMGAVGRGTLREIHARLNPRAQVQILAPAANDESGSEALLRAIKQTVLPLRRVLLLRAARGREWLGEKLVEQGVQVEPLAVYDRAPHAMSEAERAWLKSLDATKVDSVFSSSEAVSTLHESLRPFAGMWDRLLQGTAIAPHLRIEQRLIAGGFKHVRAAELEAEAILAALDQGCAQ